MNEDRSIKNLIESAKREAEAINDNMGEVNGMSSQEDETALGALFEAYGELVNREVSWWLKQNVEISTRDISQIVWSRVITKIGTFEGDDDEELCEQKFCKWLKNIAKHATLNYIKQTKAKRRGGDRKRQDLGKIQIRSQDRTPSSICVANEQQQKMYVELAKLDPTDQKIMKLRFEQGHTYAEIADQLDLTIDLVRYRVGKNVRKLSREAGQD